MGDLINTNHLILHFFTVVSFEWLPITFNVKALGPRMGLIFQVTKTPIWDTMLIVRSPFLIITLYLFLRLLAISSDIKADQVDTELEKTYQWPPPSGHTEQRGEGEVEGGGYSEFKYGGLYGASMRCPWNIVHSRMQLTIMEFTTLSVYG